MLTVISVLLDLQSTSSDSLGNAAEVSSTWMESAPSPKNKMLKSYQMQTFKSNWVHILMILKEDLLADSEISVGDNLPDTSSQAKVSLVAWEMF